MTNRIHNHYFKDVSKLNVVDVYRVLSLFNVTDPCIQHAVKKLLVAGGRGAGKDISRDIQEAMDSLKRWAEMRQEDAEPEDVPKAASDGLPTTLPPYIWFSTFTTEFYDARVEGNQIMIPSFRQLWWSERHRFPTSARAAMLAQEGA